jgi:hypothetical protein
MSELLTSEWFKQYGAAIFTLLGAVVAAFLAGAWALVNAWIMRNRDLRLKLWEKLLDRRIGAHDSVLHIVLVQRQNEGEVQPKGRDTALRAGIFKA